MSPRSSTYVTVALLAPAGLLLACGSPSRKSAPQEAEADFSGKGVAGGVATSPPPSPPPLGIQVGDRGSSSTVLERGQSKAGGARMPNVRDVGAADSAAVSMIIRTGQASIEVDSLDTGIAQVRQLAQRLGGYVANTTVQVGHAQTHTATLELKLPAPRFDEAISGLTPIGKVEYVNVTAEDVGEEYVDVSARVANARRLEERLVELLGTRTGKLSDVLQVERELARVREEIERHEGRLRYLKSRSAMSTLSVTVHEPLPVVGQHGSGGVILESLRQAWRNFVGFVAGFISALGILVPLAALAMGVVVVGRRLWRQRRRVGEGQ